MIHSTPSAIRLAEFICDRLDLSPHSDPDAYDSLIQWIKEFGALEPYLFWRNFPDF